jgi:hypothetical protein
MCTIERTCFAPLIDAGLLHELVGRKGRWVWARLSADKCLLNAPELDLSQKGYRSPLEFVLRAEPDAAKQAYLARAAFRYIGDNEASQKGPSVTMNWSFVPGGKVRKAGRGAGMDMMSLSADRALAMLHTNLDKQEILLLHAILVRPKPIYQLLNDFGVKRDAFSQLGLKALHRLAKVYDTAVPQAHN